MLGDGQWTPFALPLEPCNPSRGGLPPATPTRLTTAPGRPRKSFLSPREAPSLAPPTSASQGRLRVGQEPRAQRGSFVVLQPGPQAGPPGSCPSAGGFTSENASPPYLPLRSGTPGASVLWPSPPPAHCSWLSSLSLVPLPPSFESISVTRPPPPSSYSFSLHPLPPGPSLPSLFCALRVFAHLKSFLSSTSLQPLLAEFSPEGGRALLLPRCPPAVIAATAPVPRQGGWWCEAWALPAHPLLPPQPPQPERESWHCPEVPPHPFPAQIKGPWILERSFGDSYCAHCSELSASWQGKAAVTNYSHQHPAWTPGVPASSKDRRGIPHSPRLLP